MNDSELEFELEFKLRQVLVHIVKAKRMIPEERFQKTLSELSAAEQVLEELLEKEGDGHE